MKYKLKKEQITGLSWYSVFTDDNKVKHSDILVCHGFNTSPKEKDINVLPDIVEEFVPKGTIQFDDWDNEVMPVEELEFFFKIPKKTGQDSQNAYNEEEDSHYVRINRNWLEPVV